MTTFRDSRGSIVPPAALSFAPSGGGARQGVPATTGLVKKTRPTAVVIDDDPQLLNGIRRTISGIVDVKTANNEITQNQIEKAVSLASDKIIAGKVVSKGTNELSVETTVSSIVATASGPLKNSTTTTVNVLFVPQKDRVLTFKQTPVSSTSSTLQNVDVSFNDIKVGQQIIIKILGGKKTIYLLPTQ